MEVEASARRTQRGLEERAETDAAGIRVIIVKQGPLDHLQRLMRPLVDGANRALLYLRFLDRRTLECPGLCSIRQTRCLGWNYQGR